MSNEAEMTKLKINLIGPGKVGQTLMRRIVLAGGHEVQDIAGRDVEAASRAVQFIGAGTAVSALADMRPADLWLLTVSDTRIADVAARLAELAPDRPSIAVHCSGFLPAAEMQPLRALGWHLASVHPVLTFADPARAVGQFEGTLCGVEGDTEAVTVVDALIRDIGGQPFPLSSQHKAIYHAAAVFSNNFTVVLQAVAREAWARAGVPEEIIGQLNARLLAATAENVGRLGPAAALTGPAARGDLAIVAQQEAAVRSWHPDAGKAYAELSLLAGRLKRTGTTLETGGV
ncbi:DUF2520 domain-containing protein [Mesorhizobium loti]|nr:hypothetical protein ASE05_11425 [Mesorhizobium sp. Root172]QKC70354.1 DUF2520 domain-containing protein [Mesorhizobium loti]